MESTAILNEFKELMAAQQANMAKMIDEKYKNGAPSPELSEKAERLEARVTEILAQKAASDAKAAQADERISDLEAKIARRRDEQKAVDPLGDALKANADAIRNMAERKSSRAYFTLETKDVTTPAAASQSITNRNAEFGRGPIDLGLYGMVESLIPQRPIDTGGATIIRQGTFTNNAGVQTEGSGKGESDIAYTQVNFPVQTIAHFIQVSQQALEDLEGMRFEVENRLLAGLAVAKENQILNGTGTAPNLQGLIPGATAYSTALTVSGDNDMDRIRRAILQTINAQYLPSGIVVSPQSWATMETLKSSAGGYFIGNPNAASPAMRLWGLPAATSLRLLGTGSPAVPNWLVGAFASHCVHRVRQGIQIALSSEDATNFQANLVTIRAEMRMAQVIYQPGAFFTGTYA